MHRSNVEKSAKNYGKLFKKKIFVNLLTWRCPLGSHRANPLGGIFPHFYFILFSILLLLSYYYFILIEHSLKESLFLETVKKCQSVISLTKEVIKL